MKPLLAEKVDLDRLRFPYLVSPKFDGFRCLMHSGNYPQTRSLKPIVNNYVRGKLTELQIPYLDGELLTFTGGKVDDFNTVQSKLSTKAGMPDFQLHVFDCFRDPNAAFNVRLNEAGDRIEQFYTRLPAGYDRVKFTAHHEVNRVDELLLLYQVYLDAGWEGIMLRDPLGRYKYGRSTLNENILLKLKPLDDEEGEVVGAQEQMHNANEATTSELGYKTRSSHKENMVPMNRLGALHVKWRDVVFDIGTGFSLDQRNKFWTEDLVGRVVTFKYQGVGSGGKPRFPRFKGFRAKEDLA